MKRRQRSVLFLTAAFVLILLTALPQSGWLVREESRFAIGAVVPPVLKTSGRLQENVDAAERHTAASHPDDFALQLAYALRTAPPSSSQLPANATGNDTLHNSQLRAMLPLREHFPNQPELYAHILRYLSLGDIKLHREESDRLEDRKPSAQDSQPSAAIADPLALEAAARGEALDPQNSYFPAMAAIALFDTHQDAEALAALHRAAQCPVWNDYANQEVKAYWKLDETAHGQSGSVGRMAIAAAVLFPHMAKLREAARIATCLAMDKEISGDTEGGLAIRRDVMRFGAGLRVQGPSAIGSLVGAAITGTAASRPGGSPFIKKQNEESNDSFAARRMSLFVTYLNNKGHAEDADWYLAEARATEKMKGIVRHGNEVSVFSLTPIYWLVAEHMAGTALFLYAVLILLLGGVSRFLANTDRIRKGLPLHKAIRCGFVLTLFLLPLVFTATLAAMVSNTEAGAFVSDLTVVVISALSLLMLLIAGFYLKRGETGKGWARNAGLCAITTVVLIGLTLLPLFANSGMKQLGLPLNVLNALASTGDSGSANAFSGMNQIAMELVCSFFGPFLFTIFLAFRARKRGIPLSVGVVRGYRSGAVPAASLLILLFAAVACITLYQEKNVDSQLKQLIVSEGRYDAALLHDEWPGVTILSDKAQK